MMEKSVSIISEDCGVRNVRGARKRREEGG